MAAKIRGARKAKRGPATRKTSVFDLAREHRLAPILASDVVGEAPSLIELAWDGHRVLACALGKEIRIVSSDFREWNDRFPTIVRALQRLNRSDVVLEGFLCALGPNGLPSFDLLRHRSEEHTSE